MESNVAYGIASERIEDNVCYNALDYETVAPIRESSRYRSQVKLEDNVSYNALDYETVAPIRESSRYRSQVKLLENTYAIPKEEFTYPSKYRTSRILFCSVVTVALAISLFSLLVAVVALVVTTGELQEPILLDSAIMTIHNNASMQRDKILIDIDNIQSVIDDLNPTAFFPGTLANPATSCSEIPHDRPSGNYWIQNSNANSPIQVFCNMDHTGCSCNAAREWMRVANINMTDSNQTCPTAFTLKTSVTPPLRTCGRSVFGCTHAIFPTFGIEYSRVCGKIIAYQDGSPDGFFPYNVDLSRTIDDHYVDGISLTHGRSPRQHIWTFAAALDELTSFGPNRSCPCINSDIETGVAPPFINSDYFCDTGSRDRFQHILYPHDPLWDGQGCGGASTCCQFNKAPWFCKQLPRPTVDDIELRMCFDHGSSDEDIPIELVQIFVQ